MKKVICILAITSSLVLASSGQEVAQANGCMECHNIKGKKLAPAFMGTARKNIKMYGDEAKEYIMKGIKLGSKGKFRNFSDTQMPPFPHLSEEELDTIASWILEEYKKNSTSR